MDPGQVIQLKVLRNNKTIDLKVPLGAQSDTELAASEIIQKIGLEVDNATPEMASRLNLPADTIGVIVTKVMPGSAAQQAGIKPGFLITGIAMHGNEPKMVKNTAEFDNALKNIKQRKHVILIVRHQNFQRYYTIKIS